jgi:CheY-like chemotaxis protein/two-component sensor histidine kinase
VQRILSFSRRQPPERKPIALAPVVEEAVHLLRASLPAGVILEFHCEPGVPVVMADATQIEQVVINLATNAMQAMQGGPGRIGIRLDAVVLDEALAERHVQLRALYAKRPGRTVRLTMNDNGMGIEAALLPRIFEPFYTTKPVDEGTGLGLSVVHGIVQAHDGVIEVESRLGKGTTFTVYLPAADIPLEAPEAGRDAALAALARDSGDMRHILYVDDDSALVFLVKRRLERGRYRVSGYTKPAEALEAIRADAAAFDLVVTDYNMPCMSGLEVAREVRTIRADLPVVVASGFIDEKLHAHADEAGVKGLIFKANTVEDLCEAIARLARTLREKSTPGQVRE